MMDGNDYDEKKLESFEGESSKGFWAPQILS